MSKIKNTIEINGKIYDAHSGKHIGSMDDGAELVKEELAQISQDDKPRRQNKREHHPVSANRHPDRSKTLMRPGLKKPGVKPAHKAKKDAATRQVRLGTPGPEREKRAKEVGKSPKITRFNTSESSAVANITKVPKKIRPLEVKEPSKPAAVPHKPVNDWPVVDQFEKALQSASSHLEEFVDEAAHSKKSRKFAYAGVTLVALLAIGFGAYQAVPVVQVKMAGNKAGFSPGLPSYSPAGFGLDNPAATSGEVTLSYKSRTDDKGFKIIQAPSEWSGESLVNNFLAPSGKQYQTVRTGDKTIYTYDDSSATWVDGRIWYKLESNANLSSEQLIKIANGL